MPSFIASPDSNGEAPDGSQTRLDTEIAFQKLLAGYQAAMTSRESTRAVSMGDIDMESESSFQYTREPQYISNDDIALVHEIVTAAEETLADLPGRERLHTNALFHAADGILPAHGIDPDAASHISKLLFEIGGLPGPLTLLEKFKAVMQGIGIEVDIVTDPDDSSVSDPAVAPQQPSVLEPEILLADVGAERTEESAVEEDNIVRSTASEAEDGDDDSDDDDVAMSLVATEDLTKESEEKIVEAKNDHELPSIEAQVDEPYVPAIQRSEEEIARTEKLAGLAWEVFLKSKAFTHWAARAAEDAERTAIARRHMLRRKLFRAWKLESNKSVQRARLFERQVVIQHWQSILHDQASRLQLASRSAEMTLRDLALLTMVSHHNQQQVLERKLVECQQRQDTELLDSSSYQWYCEMKVLELRRKHGIAEKRRILGKWARAAQAFEEREQLLDSTAEHLHRSHTIENSVHRLQVADQDQRRRAEKAHQVYIKRIGPSLASKWCQQSQQLETRQRQSQDLEKFAANEYYAWQWKRRRKEAWESRMRNLYSEARHKVRCSMIHESLDTWRQGTADLMAGNSEADSIKTEAQRNLIISVTNTWLDLVETHADSYQSAVEVDKEHYTIAWHSLLTQHGELAMDSAAYDNGQTRASCWECWEFASLELRGRNAAVQEVIDRNQKKLRRQLVAEWAGQVVSADRIPDLRASRMSTSKWAPSLAPLASTPAMIKGRHSVMGLPRDERAGEATPYRRLFQLPYRTPATTGRMQMRGLRSGSGGDGAGRLHERHMDRARLERAPSDVSFPEDDDMKGGGRGRL